MTQRIRRIGAKTSVGVLFFLDQSAAVPSNSVLFLMVGGILGPWGVDFIDMAVGHEGDIAVAVENFARLLAVVCLQEWSFVTRLLEFIKLVLHEEIPRILLLLCRFGEMSGSLKSEFDFIAELRNLGIHLMLGP